MGNREPVSMMAVRRYTDQSAAELEAGVARACGWELAHVVEFTDPAGAYYCVQVHPTGIGTAVWLCNDGVAR